MRERGRRHAEQGLLTRSGARSLPGRKTPRRLRGAAALVLGAGVAASLLLPAAGAALPVLLEDGSAFVTLDAESPEALSALTVDGSVHLRSGSFFWRVGPTGPETSFAALDAALPLLDDRDGDGSHDAAVLGFEDPSGRFSVELHAALAGTPFGPPSAGAGAVLDLELVVANLSGAPLDLQLFQLLDVDLFGSFGDDEALFSGAPDTLRVTDASGLGAFEATWAGAPDGVEAALFDALGASLGDGEPTALAGTLAAGPGDVTAAASFGLALAPGATARLAQSQTVDVHPLPAPAAPGLLGAAALARAARAGRGRWESRR